MGQRGGWMVGPNDPDDGAGGSKRIEETGDWSKKR